MHFNKNNLNAHVKKDSTRKKKNVNMYFLNLFCESSECLYL